jgi:hypothetical protein
MKRTIKRKFAEMLRGHDWTYHYSDDMGYWKAGAAQHKNMMQFVRDNDSHREELWAMYTHASPLVKVQDIMDRYDDSPRYFKAVPCGNYQLSIQASEGHYCTPRETLGSVTMYTEFELAINDRNGNIINPDRSVVIKAFPHYDKLFPYYGGQLVFGWVPVDVINKLYHYLKRHGK